MKLSNKYFIPLLLLLLALGMNMPAFSQSPMEIRSMYDQHPLMTINFDAGNNQPGDLDAIRIYEANGHTDNLNDFTLIREYDLSNYPNVDSVTWNSQVKSIRTTKSNNFQYKQNMSYYMTAVIGNNESNAPDSLYYTYFKEPLDSINFTVFPPSVTTITIGEQFTHNPSAITSGNKIINYGLIDPPNSDASINKETGLLTYNATVAGTFTFIIRAYIESNPSNYVEQKMKVKVMKCTTYINGNLTSKNQALENIIRISYDIYKVDADSSTYYSSGALDNNYSFTAIVDEGLYQVKINGYTQEGQISIWYNNTKYIQEADVLETSCGDSTIFDWEVDLSIFGKESITLLPFNSGNEFEIVNKGEIFEQEIKYTTTPADGEVQLSLSYNKDFILTGPNNNILKLDTQEPGFHQTVVNASLKSNQNVRASQLVTVWQNECEDLTNLKINLKDKGTGELYKGNVVATIYLASAINDSNMVIKGIDSDTLSNGKLEFNVPKGEYLLELSISTYHNNKLVTYLYKYKTDKPIVGPNDKFELIEVGCDDMAIDWEIIPPTPIVDYTISGYVNDEKTNLAIEYAQIEVIGKDKLTDVITRSYSYTNNNGYFSIRVPNNSIYTVSAHSAYDTIDIKPYLREYWEETANPLEATLLDLTGNVDNINFTLTEKPDYENVLNGKVYDEDLDGVESAIVVVYLIEPSAFGDEYKYWSTSAIANNFGVFEFKNLIPGDYIVYTYVNDRKYKPGYYVKGSDNLTQSWLDASKVTVGETGDFGDVPLNLAPLKPIASNKGLRGKVGRLKGVSPGSSAALNPLSGVQVFVTNSDDEVINYNYSEIDGGFEVPNLENGELNVYFDKVGFRMEQEQITVSDVNSNVVIDVDMQQLSTTDVMPFEAINARLYPNPSAGNVTITGDFKLGSYIVKVIDMTGSTVKIIPIEIAGANINLDLSGVSVGQYYIKLIGNNSNYSTKVTIIK